MPRDTEKISVTMPQQRYGKDELITMSVPNPNRKKRRKREI
jgi:hypothetical protein